MTTNGRHDKKKVGWGYQEVLLAAIVNELSSMLIRFSDTMSSMFGAGMTTTKSLRPYHRQRAWARLGNVLSQDIKSCQMTGTAAFTTHTGKKSHTRMYISVAFVSTVQFYWINSSLGTKPNFLELLCRPSCHSINSIKTLKDKYNVLFQDCIKNNSWATKLQMDRDKMR